MNQPHPTSLDVITDFDLEVYLAKFIELTVYDIFVLPTVFAKGDKKLW